MAMMELREGGLLGKFGRSMYAVLCLGVIIVATTVVYYAFSEPAAVDDAREKSRRRLAALQRAEF